MGDDEVETARGHLYALLGALLARPPTGALLARAAGIDGGAGGRLGAALGRLATAAAAVDPVRAREEYDRLFIGVVRGELVPYASYYRTGFLHEKPLARLRRDLARLKVARAPGNSDPEDHIAALCETMALLVNGDAAGRPPEPLATQRSFFREHLHPWGGQFFADLERFHETLLYGSVGSLGAAFLTLEEEAFALSAGD